MSVFKLEICTAFLRSELDSNMAIIEINLPSGFEFEIDSIEQLKGKHATVMRYDLEDGNTKVNIYLSSISKKQICIDVEANRVFKVAKPAQSYVQVYDYYDTTKKVRAFYDPPEYRLCDICRSSEIGIICEQNCV